MLVVGTVHRELPTRTPCFKPYYYWAWLILTSVHKVIAAPSPSRPEMNGFSKASFQGSAPCTGSSVTYKFTARQTSQYPSICSVKQAQDPRKAKPASRSLGHRCIVMSCFVTLLPAVPIWLTSTVLPISLFCLSCRKVGACTACGGLRMVQKLCPILLEHLLTWPGEGWEWGRCSGRKSLPFQLSCIIVGDWYFLCTLGQLMGTELSRNTAVQATFGSWHPAGRGGPLTRRGASSMLVALCIAFLEETPQRERSVSSHSLPSTVGLLISLAHVGWCRPLQFSIQHSLCHVASG